MNNIVKIKKSLYNAAARLYSTKYPERAAYLTEDPEGQAYFFTAYSGYVVLHDVAPGVIEVRGAFKTNSVPGFAQAIVEWCRRLGANTVQLDCFAPVAHAWAAAGLNTYAMVLFDQEFAPSGWLKEYGTPNVLYMRKHFGG